MMLKYSMTQSKLANRRFQEYLGFVRSAQFSKAYQERRQVLPNVFSLFVFKELLPLNHI